MFYTFTVTVLALVAGSLLTIYFQSKSSSRSAVLRRSTVLRRSAERRRSASPVHHASPSDWACASCTADNTDDRTVCYSCSCSRGIPPSHHRPASPVHHASPTGWACATCTADNTDGRTVCFACARTHQLDDHGSVPYTPAKIAGAEYRHGCSMSTCSCGCGGVGGCDGMSRFMHAGHC